jgi:hypothetical protein
MATAIKSKSKGELSHDEKHALAAQMTDELRGGVLISFDPGVTSVFGRWTDPESGGHQWCIRENGDDVDDFSTRWFDDRGGDPRAAVIAQLRLRAKEYNELADKLSKVK